MLKTKDGHEVVVGDWVYDTTGIYEIIDTCYDEVTLKEIIFDNPEDGSTAYHHGDYRYLKFSEMAHMLYE